MINNIKHKINFAIAKLTVNCIKKVFKSNMINSIIELDNELVSICMQQIIGSNVVGLIVKSENGLFAVKAEDFGVGKILRTQGKYGLDEVEQLKPYIKSDTRVLIVGAHIGTLSVPIAKLCKDVVAIEANPDTYNLLKINLSLNSVTNCQAINIGASDREENIEFLLSTANSGGSKRVPKIHEFMYYYDNPKTISVKAVSLDNHLDNLVFDIVFMDIEGSEYFALRGMQKILSQCKLLSVEFLPHHLKNVAGVTVEQFLSVIQPHFLTMTIPSKGIKVSSADFLTHLNKMYDLGEGDDGILFEKI
jgi:FkbM family methyltransferase